jgi:hypothetical protein
MRARRQRSTRPAKLGTTGGLSPFLALTDWPVTNEGAFAVELWFSMVSWTPGVNVFVARHGFGDGNLSWSIEILTTGRPRASYYPTGLLASRVGTEASADPGFVNGRPYGLRVSLLSDLFGVASAYLYEVNYGARWQTLGGITQAARVPVVFDSPEQMAFGISLSVIDLYSVRLSSPTFGPSQHLHAARALDANIGAQRFGATSWPDLVTPSATWNLLAGVVDRSDRPMPYAA